MSENETLPFRFRYLTCFYEKIRLQMVKKCRLTPELWEENALEQLGLLYCEHLDLLAGDAFIDFYSKTRQQESGMECQESSDKNEIERCWRQLLKEKRMLRKLVDRWTRDFIRHVSLLSWRMERNWEEIQEKIGRRTGKVVEVDKGNSDIHQGKCVHIIRFQSGDKVVYKPRDLKLDQKWQDYLQDMSQKAGLGKFLTPWIIEKKGYGYEEFIKSTPVTGKEGFPLFYFRCGFLLGIAYVLQGTDLHAENMIACGDWPVLIDLETGVRACAVSALGEAKIPLRDKYHQDSVMKTNLLPFLSAGGNICLGNDAFTSSKAGFYNLPFDEKGRQRGDCYADRILEGFILAYDTVQKFGITEDFRDCHVRFLIRNTSDYADVQNWVYSAKGVKNRKEFERHLACLEKMYKKKKTRSFFACGLLKQEKAAVRKGYIPRLTVSLDRPCREVRGMTLRKLLTERWKELNEDDKQLQCRRIAVSLNKLIPQDSLYFECKRIWSGEKPLFCQVEKILSERILFWEKILLQDKTPEGILVAEENHRYYLTNLPFHMMEGFPGLLPAFAAWHTLSGSGKAKELAERILKELYRSLSALNLKSYCRSFPNGLKDMLDMTELVGTFYFSLYLMDIRNMILSAMEGEKQEEPAPDMDNRSFENGLLGGMRGALFPSFSKGEGGWLYAIQRKYAPELFPAVYRT